MREVFPVRFTGAKVAWKAYTERESKLIVVSHHRSEALAARKHADLARLYPQASVTLLSRRNARGAFSERGQTFVWEVIEREKRIELVLHFDYGDEGGRDLIRFQVHVFGPGKATDAEAIAAIKQANRGEGWPKGWNKKAIYWSKPNSRDRRERQTDPIRPSLRRAALAGGEARMVARKTATPKRRRINAKRKAAQ